MFKVNEYIYIFSKLLTSFVLLGIVFIMGILLYQSYNEIESNQPTEDRILELSNSISSNNSNLKDINQQIKKNSLIIQNINKNINYEKNQNRIEELLTQNKDLKEEINDLKLKANNNSNINTLKKDSKELDSILNITLLKFKNGEDVFQEIILLESLSTNISKEIFEKLFLIESKSFYGMKKLQEEFNLSLNNFLNNKFEKKNYNTAIKFLFKFINIKPSNAETYQDEELNILMQSKKFLLIEEVERSLNQIKRLENNKIFFNDWIQKAEIYCEFNKLLLRVE